MENIDSNEVVINPEVHQCSIRIFQYDEIRCLIDSFEDHMIAWSARGKKDQDFIIFEFKTFLNFKTVINLVRSAGSDTNSLTEEY